MKYAIKVRRHTPVITWFVVVDPRNIGSRFVNFIRDGTVVSHNSEIYNIGVHAQ